MLSFQFLNIVAWWYGMELLNFFFSSHMHNRNESICLTQLPPIHKNYNLEVNQSKSIAIPKLQRIIDRYGSMSSRMLTNAVMIESMLNKRPFQDMHQQLKEQEIENMLRATRMDKDQRLRNRVGREAQFKFYENYKKLDKMLCQRKSHRSAVLASIDNDPSLPMLQVSQNLGILPCCMGMVKQSGDANVVNIAGQRFGDKYIQALSAGIKQAKIIDNLQFCNNRLTDQGLKIISDNLTLDVIKIDVSFNKISNVAANLLSLIINPEVKLEHINLENNLIADKAATILFQSVLESKSIKYLNLRKNQLTKACVEGLSELIERTTCLEYLYIGANRINEEAGATVVEALEDNKTIKVFDYCMNNLGDSKNPTNSCKIAKNLGKVLSSNKVLVHVDFSGNGFNEEESKIISEGLSKNKKIYGFHYSGNFGYIDAKGFLQVDDKNNGSSLHSVVNKHIKDYQIVFRRESNSRNPSKFCNVCWICEGWYEQTFKFVVPEPREDGKNYVYIHFDFQQFQPRLINITEIKVKYKAMVPPRKYRYFYTWNGHQIASLVPNGTSKHISDSVHHNTIQKLDPPLRYAYEMNHENVSFEVKEVSCATGKPKKIVNDYEQIIVSVVPRQDGLTSKKEKKQWTYKDSVWAKEWKLEDDQLTKNCFEKDWKCSKLTNFVKNQAEQDKIKQILFKNYKLIKQLYRHYASWSPFNGDIWAVSNNAFTEFCYLAKIISKETPLTIIDLTFITTNSISGSDYKGNSLVPERGLVRFQFMEGLVRLSEEKFKKNGLADSIFGSLTNMLNDHIQPLAGLPLCNSEKWRCNQYFCEQNDMLVKKYRPIFTQIYKKNSRMKVKPGNKPFMCLAEFKSIIERIGIAGTSVLERDIFLSFNCSMMTQVDELENERFIRMTEIEFVEAVARCAYILPDTCKMEDIFGQKVPFHGKFEWIIHQLKMLCSEEIKTMFSEQTSLFNKSEDD